MSKTTTQQNDWQEVKLGEVVEVNPLERLEKNSIAKKIPMEALEIFQKKISFYQEKQFKGGLKFRNGDTLVPRITPSLENGKTAFVDVLNNNEVGFGSTEFIVLRNKENITDKEFIYYLARSSIFRGIAIKSMTGTSGRQRVQTNEVINYQFKLPPLSKQKAIAEVLSSFDDKINLLHRQNKTLEDMAQALFRKWFIDNPDKEEWELGKLDNIIEIFDSKRVPLSKMQRDEMKEGTLYPYYGAAQLMDYVNDYIFDGEYILLGEDGTVRTNEGYPILQYAVGKFWVNNHTHILHAKKPYANFFIWHFLLRKNINDIITGAVQPKISQTNLKSLDFPKFPLNLVLKFQDNFLDTFQKILKNKSQIHILEDLRDTLLPKLMKGEVRVNF